jgi:hypothetical protein
VDKSRQEQTRADKSRQELIRADKSRQEQTSVNKRKQEQTDAPFERTQFRFGVVISGKQGVECHRHERFNQTYIKKNIVSRIRRTFDPIVVNRTTRKWLG